MTNGRFEATAGQQRVPSGVRPERPNRPPAVHVTSFTYRHGPIPVADITLDLRQFGETAQLKPDDLTNGTRCDTCTPLAPEADGLPELIEGVVPVVSAYRTGPGDGPVTVAVGGSDGHLPATVATALQRRLARHVHATLAHHKPEAAGHD
ncbi:hypothetical protein [Streptomyces sp. NPDC004134]|uniref:hypothetical protein n=1 Tax=Streptomyces sp. NPDC004134 TaxID=3364691 RepID=UPI0036ACBCF5